MHIRIVNKFENPSELDWDPSAWFLAPDSSQGVPDSCLIGFPERGALCALAPSGLPFPPFLALALASKATQPDWL